VSLQAEKRLCSPQNLIKNPGWQIDSEIRRMNVLVNRYHHLMKLTGEIMLA
jgi:hypothetical protein